MVRAVLPKLLDQGCRVVHLTGGNDPEINQLRHPNLTERQFSDDIPGLLQHATWPSAEPVPEASVNWRLRHPHRAGAIPPGRRSPSGCQCRLCSVVGAAVIVHQHHPNDPVLANTIERLIGARLDHPTPTPTCCCRCNGAWNIWLNAMPTSSWPASSAQPRSYAGLEQCGGCHEATASQCVATFRKPRERAAVPEQDSMIMLNASRSGSKDRRPEINRKLAAEGIGVMPVHANSAASMRLPSPSNAGPGGTNGRSA